MLSLFINGTEEKFFIGCRTFISVYELLHRLEMPADRRFSVQIDGQPIPPEAYLLRAISSGARLVIENWAEEHQGDVP